jgi:hypothetical protein
MCAPWHPGLSGVRGQDAAQWGAELNHHRRHVTHICAMFLPPSFSQGLLGDCESNLINFSLGKCTH